MIWIIGYFVLLALALAFFAGAYRNGGCTKSCFKGPCNCDKYPEERMK